VPPSLRISIEVPHAGTVSGMGIPSGVTLIVGGGYHGKSTLLQALERGIYDHMPGDGRDNCVSLPDPRQIRAASGRSVSHTDISAFIGAIPRGADTAAFSSTNASGSTSQAASIAEAMEVGASVLLLDEDTSATNFMIRDKRMQELVAKQDEPITAFVDRVKPLHAEHGISTVLVMGGSGDYFGVADCVIQMLAFQPRDVTPVAREIAVRYPTARTAEGQGTLARPRARRPHGEGLDPHNAHGHFRIRAAEPHRLTYGSRTIDLSDVEQLIDAAQTRAIGRAMHLASPWMDGSLTLRELVGRVMAHLHREGLDGLDPERMGDLAVFRALELAATLNRIRGLVVTQDR
jgi:predicted ABC-class ATPase